MNSQDQTPFTQQLQELDALYHEVPPATYEAALQSAVTRLQQVLPAFTIAYAEIFTAGRERQLHGGMRHVLLPRPTE